MTRIEIIHESLINGQRRQMIDQIDDYGLYDFWADYADYLASLYIECDAQYNYFKDVTISYSRIKLD